MPNIPNEFLRYNNSKIKVMPMNEMRRNRSLIKQQLLVTKKYPTAKTKG